jgi:hypothetical protein
MEGLDSRIAGYDKIRVVAEPLQAAIPDVSVNIVIGARGHSQECDVPHRGQCQPNDNDLSRKAWFGEELTDGE